MEAKTPEAHPFLGLHFPPQAQTLILGSFPCPGKEGYGDWFYSGSGRNFFWPLLSETFRAPTLTLQQKLQLCEAQGIAISDVFAEVSRSQGNCSDSNLIIHRNSLPELKQILSRFTIQQILFTSKFVQRYFSREIEPHLTDCPAKLFCLPSPSPAANRAIGMQQDYKQLKATGILNDTLQYRLLKFREALLPT